jgi:pSer/pThr/pTyr-binding forkhead associated (FHA) protein
VRTRPQGFNVGASGAGDDAPTRVISPGGSTAIDPVCGWFVSVHGPEKGRDYRIRSENNTIGRSKDMYICITGDESISRERHAVITFDPQQNAFHLGPGDGRGLVYVNGEVLLAHRKLQPYDRIQMGKTKLVFVPFCGDKFTWGKDDD